MKKVLKVGDRVYTQSLQHFAPSYLEGFPQREQFLLEHANGINFSFFRHGVLDSLDSVMNERRRLREHLSGENFDYLMIDNPLSVLVVDKDVRTPIVFDCIDWYKEMYLKEFGEDRRYHLLCYGLMEIVQRADRVIAQSPVILKELESLALQTEKKVVIPNGYDSRIFYPYDEKKVLEARRRLEAKHDINLNGKGVIVYTGKLGSWYDNIKIIAGAISDDQVFLVVGDGPILKDLPNKSNIVKCGRVDLPEVPEYTNIADVLVFPVNVDCSPITISEYLAIGKPIVMGKGRMEWLLRDGSSGVMVDNDLISWRDGMRRALKMKSSCMANNLLLASTLSWQKLSRDFEKFLDS